MTQVIQGQRYSSERPTGVIIRGWTLWVLTLLIAGTFGYRAEAQINTATVTGSVTDASGAVIPGAVITAEETSSHTVRTVTSNNDGLFNIPLLQPGSYTVRVVKDGFNASERQNIDLQVNQTANLNISLTIGSTQTTVQVNEIAPLLETQNASMGTVVGTREIQNLPLNGRQFTQLLQLAPGTVPVDVSQNGGSSPAINGQTNRSNLWFVDGIYATNPFFSGTAIDPSIDAIQEFQEQTHADQAEFGQSTGGVVNLITKAGSNRFHGSGYEFFRNDALDALNYFQSERQVYHQNQFGGTFGGPILKDKLFFFGLYDGYRETKAATNLSKLPTAAELAGDFSAVLPTTVIYDPTTYDAATNTTQPFAGNIIPTDRLNQGVISTVKAFLPSSLPTSTEGYNYVNNESSVLTKNQYGIRIDYNLGARDLLFGRYTTDRQSSISPAQLPGNAFASGPTDDNAGVNWVHTYSPTLVSQITVGLNKIVLPQEQQQKNAAAVFTEGGFGAGFTDKPGGVKVSLVPGIHPSGFFDINSGWGPIGPQYTGQFAGSVNKQLGKHALKFGASAYLNGMYTNWSENDINFNQQATWNPKLKDVKATPTNPNPAGGNALASLFLGLPNSASRQLGNAGVSLRSHLVGLYAEDAWKLTPKLTVNYGLRWDYTSPVTDTHNRLSGFDINTGTWYIAKGNVDTPTGTLPAGVQMLTRDSITKPDYKNFSPRFGFAYALTRTTALRGGAGVNFDNWSGALQAAQNARGAWPSGASQNVNNQNIAGVTPGSTAQNPFGDTAPIEPSTPFPSGGGFLDTNWKDSYSWQWNLQVQQQFGNAGVLSLAYVGSSTSRAPIQVPSNVSKVLGPTQVLPFSNMSQFNTLSSIGHMNYNALQSKYERRFGGGFAIISAFTYSKTINVGCAEYWEGCNIQNPNNLRADRSASSTDVPLVFTFSSVYELPFGKGKEHLNQGVASKVLGGWQVNGILAARNGTPYTVTINYDNANANGGSQRPNQVGDPNSGPHSVKQYFNTAAFEVAPTYTYGDVRRNSLRGPGYTNVDFSLIRNFEFWERIKLELRAELFNSLNHPNFNNPDATLGDSTFGQIGSAGDPREVQFAGRFTF